MSSTRLIDSPREIPENTTYDSMVKMEKVFKKFVAESSQLLKAKSEFLLAVTTTREIVEEVPSNHLIGRALPLAGVFVGSLQLVLDAFDLLTMFAEDIELFPKKRESTIIRFLSNAFLVKCSVEGSIEKMNIAFLANSLGAVAYSAGVYMDKQSLILEKAEECQMTSREYLKSNVVEQNSLNHLCVELLNNLIASLGWMLMAAGVKEGAMCFFIPPLVSLMDRMFFSSASQSPASQEKAVVSGENRMVASPSNKYS